MDVGCWMGTREGAHSCFMCCSASAARSGPRLFLNSARLSDDMINFSFLLGLGRASGGEDLLGWSRGVGPLWKGSGLRKWQ